MIAVDHGEALRRLTGNESLVQQLAADPLSAAVSTRERALIEYAVSLTREPSAMTAAAVQRLREAGLSDEAIHGAAAVAAYFNFVNRIALGLGVELESRI